MNEGELVRASQAGDRDAFGRLIRAYEDRIYALARQVCAAAPAEAEDVYAETFLTAFKKIRQFRGGASLGTWLYRIAANLCWMRRRKLKREPFVPLLDNPQRLPRERLAASGMLPADGDPLRAAAKSELSAAVAEALSKLPMEYRLVVVLRDVQGLSGPETAKALGIGLAAMKSRLHRGRLFLRDRLHEGFA